jgi:hypothetical protein
MRNPRWVLLMGLVLLGGQALTVPGQVKLDLEISATCENAVLSINGRIYSGRPVTLSVPLGEVVTLQAVYQQLPNCGVQQVLHYFDRWDFNGEPYSKAPQQLRLRAGQLPFTANSRVQAAYRSQFAEFCAIAIDAQDSLGQYLPGTFIDVRPFDILGDGGGVTPFVRSFDTLTDVWLQASSQVSFNGKSYRFARWEVEEAQLLLTFSADPTLVKLRCRAARTLAHALYVIAEGSGCPDLTIRHLYVDISQLSPYTWLLKPRVYVENVGTTTVPIPTKTAFLLNGQPIAEVTTAPLAPGTGEQASITHVITSGNYILTVMVDSQKQISECDENNNIKEAIIQVP